MEFSVSWYFAHWGTKENWDDRKMIWVCEPDVTLFVPFIDREEGAQWRLQTKTTSLSVRIHYGFLMTRGEYVSRLLGAILRSPPNLKAYTSTHFPDHLCQFLLPNCQEASLFIFIYCALYTKNCLKHGVGMVWKKNYLHDLKDNLPTTSTTPRVAPGCSRCF